MRIRGWHIDGFGVFRDHRIDALPDGMTVFVGPNEAGKSTLLGFLRGVLFDYPKGRSSEPQYPPLQGGAHGGLVSLDEDGAGQVVVSRYADRKNSLQVTLPNGTQGTEADLAVLLGGVDKVLFQQVFAFSLWELQKLEALQEEGVQEEIFTAGIKGAGQSAAEAIRGLKAETDALHLARGRTTKLAGLLVRYKDLTDELRTAQAEAGRYSELCVEEERCLAQMHDAEKAQKALQGRLARCKLLISLWPTWSDLESAREKLVNLPAIDEFPADAERRLTELTGNCRNAQKEQERLRDAHKDKQDRCSRIQAGLSGALAEVRAAVETHMEDLRLHREHLNNRPRLKAETEQASEAAEDALRELGPQWDRATVEAFDTSLPREEEVRAWKERLNALAVEAAEAARAAEHAEREPASAERERDRVRAKLNSTAAPDESTIAAREAALSRLVELRKDIEVLEAHAQSQAALVDGQKRTQEAFAGTPKSTGPSAALVLGGIAALVLAAAVWRLVAGDPAAFAALSCIAVLAAAAAWFSRSKAAPSAPSWLADNVYKAEEAHKATLRLITETRAALALAARELGLNDVPAPSQVAVVERQLREDSSALDQRRIVEGRLRDAEERLGELTKAVETPRAASVRARDALAEADCAWLGWKNRLRVPEGLAPDGVLAFLSRVRAAREEGRASDVAGGALKQMSSQITAWQRRAGELLVQAGLPVPAGEGPAIDGLRDLAQACRTDSEQRRELDRLQAELAELDALASTAEKEAEQARRQLDALLAEAGVEDEAHFRTRYETYQQRKQLKQETEHRDQAIANQLGRGPEADAVVAELRTGRMDHWRLAQSQAEQEVVRAGEQFKEAVRQHQDAVNARKAVEESADVPKRELELETVRRHITQTLDEWRVRWIAKSLIETTIERFVRDNQPTLVEASRMFEQVTGGAYMRVVIEPDGKSLAIFDQAERRKEPGQLSRGTAEQLYLCLRLVLAKEFAKRGRGRSLPLVMDDVLVNFDPVRARAVAEVLAEFAKSNQVLLFTCHPETAALLSAASGGAARVVEMHAATA